VGRDERLAARSVRRRGQIHKAPLFLCCWCRRSWLNDDVTRPSEIVRSSGWGCNTFACVQQAVRHRINDSRPFAASSKQLFRTHLAARKRHYGACRSATRIYWHRQRHGKLLTAEAALDLALDVVGELAGPEFGEMDAIAGA
jgi:hypothetical protein